MDEKMFTEDEYKRLMRKARRREWMQDKAHKLNHFYYDHREDIAVFGPIVLGVFGSTAKAVHKHHQVKEEKDLKNLYVYDRSGGYYLKLKRPLSNTERLEIEARKSKGEKLGHILSSMKVLK